MSVPSLTRFKRCTRCNLPKPFFEYYDDKRSSDGKYSDCKGCRAAYRKLNRARYHDWWLEYYVQNRDKRIQNSKRYAERHPERVREYKKTYYEANREVILPRSTLRTKNRRLAIAYQMLESQGHCCAYCEVPLFGEFHIDHMTPLSRDGGNDWTNLAITCAFCNLSKRDKTAEEFMNALRP